MRDPVDVDPALTAHERWLNTIDATGVIREEIRSSAAGGNIFLLDLYETPVMHLGFEAARMHPDEYGHFRLARHHSGS